jgi:hypothetical protein
MTILHTDDAHLYEEIWDTDSVHIELAGKYGAKLEVVEYGGERAHHESRLVLHLDVTVWRALVEAWRASEWGQHPERDHDPIQLDLPGFLEGMGRAVQRAVFAPEEPDRAVFARSEACADEDE